jgi:hypothetical protein
LSANEHGRCTFDGKLRGIGSLPQGHPPRAFRHGIAGGTQARST